MRLLPGEEIAGRPTATSTSSSASSREGANPTSAPEDAVDETHPVEDDWAIIVPARTWHNVRNVGDGDLKLYSFYSPPEHPEGTIHVTKAEAEEAEHGH